MTALFDVSTVDLKWVLTWLMVGLVFGCLAGSLIGRGGHGRVGDGVALAGALIGGLLLESLVDDISWLRGSMIVASVSACAMIGIRRRTSARKARTTGVPLHRVRAEAHGVPLRNSTLCTASDDVP
jgi:uncharacterized membrane protein YeaQ/YmgE (transglycosylase-associated protein family)